MQRKTRRDAGVIQVTKRDLHCISWCASMEAVRLDQIQQLLSRCVDERHPGRHQMAESTVRGQVARWVRAGWIEYKKILADYPGWAYVTHEGRLLLGQETRFEAQVPSASRLAHIYAVNQVRLQSEQQGEQWTSKRDLPELSSGLIPDAGVAKHGKMRAVVVQMTPLSEGAYGEKMNGLLEEREYDFVHWYIAQESIKRAIEHEIRTHVVGGRARRISVVLWEGLQMGAVQALGNEGDGQPEEEKSIPKRRTRNRRSVSQRELPWEEKSACDPQRC